jgi:hypothetical protein
MSEELNDVTRRLGENYDLYKEYEKAKNRLRDQFFERVTEELAEEVPPQIIAEYEGDEEQALRQAQRQYVRHKVISTEKTKGGYKVILEEDPAFRPFEYVNPSDGRVYRRSVVAGSPSLDDDALQEENPELWHSITEVVVKRELKPLEDLTPEQVAELQPYITMPEPQVKLTAPRRATQEELDNES